MQVINCAAWHGQQRRKDVARRDSMAASTPNSQENKYKKWPELWEAEGTAASGVQAWGG